MKIGLYSITYAGIWYKGQALNFDQFARRAKSFGYDGIELDGKRPHGNPMDLDERTREEMKETLQREGIEIFCVAANNDFSSPVPEHRECQLLMVRETARLAADLGAKVVRLFAAWPGIVMRDGTATYDLVRGDFYSFERQFPFCTRNERLGFVRECLKEAAEFGKDFGVVMALQNHEPLIRHWKDCYDLVKQINSPWLKVCLDLPIMGNFDHQYVRNAVCTVGDLQVHSHFGGEYYRDSNGNVQLKSEFGKETPDYLHFVRNLKEIGYDGSLCFELCHPLFDESGDPRGFEYAEEQAELAQEFMRKIVGEVCS